MTAPTLAGPACAPWCVTVHDPADTTRICRSAETRIPLLLEPRLDSGDGDTLDRLALSLEQQPGVTTARAIICFGDGTTRTLSPTELEDLLVYGTGLLNELRPSWEQPGSPSPCCPGGIVTASKDGLWCSTCGNLGDAS